jgi:hypothetical protein
MPDYPKKFIALCRSVTAKRPKTIIDHILKHGQITTEEIKNIYGYNHPPRAVRDVREHGIPIETLRVTGSDGRKIAAYRFGDPNNMRFSKLSGRTALSKTTKDFLINKYGCRCFIYLEELDDKELQIDHRIPFEIVGDNISGELDPDDFMLLSASANRAKSWACEHCANWINIKNSDICLDCYWAYPDNYSHIAMHKLRRVDILWQGDTEVEQYELLKEKADSFEKELPKFIKKIIDKELKKNT